MSRMHTTLLLNEGTRVIQHFASAFSIVLGLMRAYRTTAILLSGSVGCVRAQVVSAISCGVKICGLLCANGDPAV